MAKSEASKTRKARSTRSTKENPGGSPSAQGKPARAHRDDTPEAKMQRARSPKSHPGKATKAANAQRRRKG